MTISEFFGVREGGNVGWLEFLGSAWEAGIGYPSGRFESGFGERYLRGLGGVDVAGMTSCVKGLYRRRRRKARKQGKEYWNIAQPAATSPRKM